MLKIKKDQILKTISDVLNEKVTKDSSQKNSKSWDSLKHIQIIMELEERFEIEFPIESVPELISVSLILEYLQIESDE